MKGTIFLASSFLLLATLLLFGCQKSHIIANKYTLSSQVSILSAVIPGTWVHPGVLNTAENLDRIRTEVNENDPDRVDAYQKVLDYINTSKFPTSFSSIVFVKASGSTPTETQFKSDAMLAYSFALKFAQTANPSDAERAKQILNGWALNFQQLKKEGSDGLSDQASLEAAWVAPTFVAAAEIIRFYSPNGVSANWAQADISQFRVFITKLKDQINKMSGRFNNWWVSAGYAKMAIGVFLESKTVYEDGKQKVLSVMDDIHQDVQRPEVIEADGTMPELCDRMDCHHFQYSLTGLTYAAEVAAIRGDSTVYNFNDSRISKGYDFMHKAYFDGIEGCLTCLSKPVYPGIEIAYRFYGTNKMRQLRNLKEPLGVTNDKVFLAFTTYTHYNVDGNTGSILNAPIDSFIALKGNNGRYVTNKDLKKPLICKRPFVSYEEVFKVVHAGWDKVALSNNNKYVSLEDGDGYINCHTLSIGINQKFSWIDAGDKLILLRGSNNAFVSANEGSEKGITCTTVKPGNDEIFQFEIADLNQLQYSLNKK